jgi:hypothetical protein
VNAYRLPLYGSSPRFMSARAPLCMSRVGRAMHTVGGHEPPCPVSSRVESLKPVTMLARSFVRDDQPLVGPRGCLPTESP